MTTPNLSLTVFFEALCLAADRHKYQRRSGFDQLPYLNHLIKVTDAIIRIGGEEDPDIILAALLHDIIEDTEMTEEELSRRFNGRTARIVRELSDDMNLPRPVRKRLQVEKAPDLSPEARKIRIADKASNIRDILDFPVDWPLEKKQYYVTNAVEVVDRIRGANPPLEKWFDEVVEEARKKLNIRN